MKLFTLKKSVLLFVCAVAFVVAAQLVRAQTGRFSTEAMWRDVEESTLDQTMQRVLIPSRYRTVRLDKALLTQALAAAPLEFTRSAAQNPIIHLPMPDGMTARFRFEHSPVVDPGLSVKYPGLQNTYRA